MGAAHECRLGTVASYLIYADMRLHIPMTHHNDRYGYGQHLWYNSEDGPSRDMWAIVDKVQLPNITGDYVLRWRWDTEQNPQIWSHCADVRIV